MNARTHSRDEKPAGAGWAHCEVGRYLGALQYFGSIGSPGISTFPLVDSVRNKEWTAGTQTKTDAQAQRLWRVDSTVREVQRQVEQSPLTPLQTSFIERDGGDRTLLKLAIRATQMGFDDRTFIIDAGYSLEMWAQSIVVQWLSPPLVNAVADLGPEPRVEAADAVALDGLLGVQILAIESPIGAAAPPLTFYRPVAAGSALTLKIPRGARDVTIYQTAAGAASAAWTWSYGDPASFAPVWALGDLPFITGLRRTPTLTLPPGATHIVSDIDLLTDRLFTIVWTIQP